MRHFQSLNRNSTDTPKIGLITLALQNGLLSELDPVLLFKFTDHCLQELKLIFLLNHFLVHRDSYFLVESPLEMFVSGNLGIELETLEASSLQPFKVEFVAKNSMCSLTSLGSCVVCQCSKNELFSSSLMPSSDTLVYYCGEVIVL